ncbi:MAG: hypothetical protein A2Z25_09475 [Planctomycetes bacterium RBG_16_55_9]|nr:MAG: hypothetical protein A2Z25_09475 [Planctomycetes bacterium RBG_16_55_9]
MKARISKFEILNNIEFSKFKCSKRFSQRSASVWIFGFRSFEFVSDFDIRISDFLANQGS